MLNHTYLNITIRRLLDKGVELEWSIFGNGFVHEQMTESLTLIYDWFPIESKLTFISEKRTASDRWIHNELANSDDFLFSLFYIFLNIIFCFFYFFSDWFYLECGAFLIALALILTSFNLVIKFHRHLAYFLHYLLSNKSYLLYNLLILLLEFFWLFLFCLSDIFDSMMKLRW